MPKTVKSSLSQRLKRYIEDGKLTKNEWRQLKPQAQSLPRVATKDSRLLLDAWANPKLQLDETTREELGEMLMDRGYPLYGFAADHFAELNVTEPSRELSELSVLVGRSDTQVNVAVLDYGFNLTHPAFKDKLLSAPGEIPDNGRDDDQNRIVDDAHSYDFLERDPDTSGTKYDDHGTGTLGLTIAGTNRIRAFAGRIGKGPGVVEAIDEAVRRGARVINMSFNPEPQDTIPAVLKAIEKYPKVLFVTAASYKSSDTGKTDLAMNRRMNLLSVAAGDGNGDHASGFGAEVMARGVAYTTFPWRSYRISRGTSFASPAVANLAAKLLLLEPDLDAQDLKWIITSCCNHRRKKSTKTDFGNIDERLSLRLGSLIALVRQGLTPRAAAQKLGLQGAEQSRLLRLNTELVRRQSSSQGVPSFSPT